MRNTPETRRAQAALAGDSQIFDSPPPTPAEARIIRAKKIARAVSLIRSGLSTTVACRAVGLNTSPRTTAAVRARCDALGIARRRSPLTPKFRTDDVWPVIVRPRRTGG